eukprot:1192344-Prorocentrum_minimum.AAC.8
MRQGLWGEITPSEGKVTRAKGCIITPSEGNVPESAHRCSTSTTKLSSAAKLSGSRLGQPSR